VPTNWDLSGASANVLVVDGLNLNGGVELQADIETELRVSDPTLGVVTNVRSAFVCFTPLGRVYFNQAVPDFNGALPSVAPLEFRVTRSLGGTPIGTIRSVILPPNGMARVFSHQ
jgi:hypothetical protein